MGDEDKTLDITLHLHPLTKRGETTQIVVGCYIGKDNEFCIETMNFSEPDSTITSNAESLSDTSIFPKYSAFPLYWDDLSDDVQNVFGMFLEELQIDTRFGIFLKAVSDQGRLKHHQQQLKRLQKFPINIELS